MGGCATKPRTLDGPLKVQLLEEKLIVEDSDNKPVSIEVSAEVKDEAAVKEDIGEQVTESKSEVVSEDQKTSEQLVDLGKQDEASPTLVETQEEKAPTSTILVETNLEETSEHKAPTTTESVAAASEEEKTVQEVHQETVDASATHQGEIKSQA